MSTSQADRRPISVGDLVLINIGDERRFVLVLMVSDRDDGIANVALTGNEFDLVTDQDVILHPDEIGLPFPLVIEGLCGPVRIADHMVPDAPMGHLNDALIGEIRAFVYLDEATGDVTLTRRGIGLRGEADPRWQFVESELELFRRVFAPWDDDEE